MAITYKDAGVDIDAGNMAVEKMKSYVKKTFRPEVLTDLGSFAGLFALDTKKYKEPVLIAGTDGVGTKLRVAMLLDKHDTIGIDAVAMCVNDILVQGAEPLFFLDYVAVGKLKPDKVATIVKGVAEGCLQSNCSLIGGETAEMPGFYGEDEYDIAGFAVGVAEKSKIINGSGLTEGDVLIGLPSTGLHSNGYSLARRILLENEKNAQTYVEELGMTVGEAMLVPTRIYVKDVMPLFEKVDIKGMCHITGGGLIENLPRVFPKGIAVKIDTKTWQKPPIFDFMQKIGEVQDDEMYRVFNMGVGFVIMVKPSDADTVLQACPDAFVMGKFVKATDDKTVKIY
jgi:phosphoribosylformylglycinamidine cyclo-ligase